jgi:hypothetical protein
MRTRNHTSLQASHGTTTEIKGHQKANQPALGSDYSAIDNPQTIRTGLQRLALKGAGADIMSSYGITRSQESQESIEHFDVSLPNANRQSQPRASDYRWQDSIGPNSLPEHNVLKKMFPA